MVYGFASQSGGFLHLDSRLGYGTRVELYLPIARSEAVAAALPISSLMRGSGETVLVVEDDPGVREVAVAFLRSLGYRFHAVGSATEALERLAKDPGISLLFSDVMLGGGMDGTELALAARKQRPGLAVLLTSGYNDTTQSSADSADEGFELLRKPYRREQLAAAVWRSINRAA
jgi:CheY-like chemotaxis protein